jgi:putative ABC transport system permease protein
MLLHGLLTFGRMLSRHRLYGILNIAGLGLGIAVFLLLSLVVRYEYGYDRFWPDAGHLYRLDQIWTPSTGIPDNRSPDCTMLAYDALRGEFPQIKAISRVFPSRATLIAQPGGTTGSGGPPMFGSRTMGTETIQFVDSGLLDVLALPITSGRRADALATPDRIMLSQRLARKYFATPDAVGRTLQVVDDGVTQTYVVSAVFRDLPASSSYQIDAAALMPERIRTNPDINSWASVLSSTLMRFASKADAASVQSRLGDLITRHTRDPLVFEYTRGFTLTPFAAMHFLDSRLGTGADRRSVIALGIVGALALLAATINYVNLATARAMLRAREVAMRKTLGASRLMLVTQFLAESTALVALAALLGLALTELTLPLMNALGGWQVTIAYGWLLPRLALLVVVVGIGAGLYPALVLASYAPARVLAASRMPSMGRMGTRVRAILVGAQFVFAIGFGICALVMDLQVAHLRTADRGFRQDGLLIVNMRDDALRPHQLALLDAFSRMPGIVSVTQSDRTPGSDYTSIEPFWRPGDDAHQRKIVIQDIGRDYFRTYAIPLVAGRLFDDAHRTDTLSKGAGDVGIVLNRSAVTTLGFASPEDAIGKPILALNLETATAMHRTIVGVVQDVRFGSGLRAVEAQVYYYQPGVIDSPNGAIRFAGRDAHAVMDDLARIWRQIIPDIQFDGASADNRLARFYHPDEQRGQLFTAGAIVSIVISCLGLYGLSAFNATRRLGEIGIRKTLGASTGDVLALLLGQFVRPVVLAALIAWPVAWFAMRTWLAGFDQRIGLSPLYFLAVTLAAIVLSVVTVLSQTLRVARAEPARALRHD